jgi:DNA-binding NarL/FixJ family response regulator
MRTIVLAVKVSSILTHLENILKDTGYKVAKVHDEQSLLNILQKNNDLILLLHSNFLKDKMIDFLDKSKTKFPNLKIMILSDIPQVNEGYPLLKYGIKAYGNSRMAKTHLMQAILFMEKNNTWLYPEFIQALIKSYNPKDEKTKNEDKLNILTTREKEIAYLVAEGLSNKEIANKSNISERTVKAHLTSIYSKLDVNDRLSLALLIK